MAEDRSDIRHSTVTLYYQQRSQSARPYVARVPAGPAVKLVGGELRHSYEERPTGKVTMGHTADFAEMKKAMMGKGTGASGPSTGPTASTSDPAGSPYAGATAHRRPSSASAATTGTLGRTKKVVYWDGKAHHVVEAPDHQGFRWVPPHLKQDDVEPGPQLGVRETPGAVRVKLIGSKYRYLPSMEPQGGSMWAISPYEASKYGTVGYAGWSGPPAGSQKPPLSQTLASMSPSARDTYARSKAIGYKEYEAATKMLNGVGSWERTQQHLLSSMDVGRPSRLTGVAEHAQRSMGVAGGGFTGLKHAAAH